MTRTAWIIGASSGIGKALALNLSRERYDLALSARSQEPLQDILKGLPKGPKNTSHPCDVSELKTLQAAYKAILGEHGKVDLMIFAAGVYTPMPLSEYDHKKSLATLDVNLTGALNTFEVIKEAATSKDHPLHLVWIGSVAGYRGLPNSCAYGISKAGLMSFAEIQRTELKELNTKVQLVSPGFVKTRLTDKNTFEMPMIISTEKAADYIAKGIKSDKFDIAFPPLFAFIMKLLRCLPDFLFFKIAKKMNVKD